MEPTECKWCGCGDIWIAKMGVILWQCGSSWESDRWESGNACRDGCLLQVEQLRDRIQRALETLKNATRFELVRDEYGSYMKGRDSYGNWLDVIEIEKVVKILEGESNDTE